MAGAALCRPCRPTASGLLPPRILSAACSDGRRLIMPFSRLADRGAGPRVRPAGPSDGHWAKPSRPGRRRAWAAGRLAESQMCPGDSWFHLAPGAIASDWFGVLIQAGPTSPSALAPTGNVLWWIEAHLLPRILRRRLTRPLIACRGARTLTPSRSAAIWLASPDDR